MSKIVIYTKSHCPYCVKAKNLLQRKNAKFTEISVSDDKIKEEMIRKSGGRMTVPQIFIGNTHVGGCDDLYDLDKKGELDGMLSSVN